MLSTGESWIDVKVAPRVHQKLEPLDIPALTNVHQQLHPDVNNLQPYSPTLNLHFQNLIAVVLVR